MKPLLTPEFMRAHPIQSGMLWAMPLCAATLFGNWLFGKLSVVSVVVVVPIWVVGGLAWGYAMKAYHDGREGAQ
jgi:hypothetical protein